MSRVNQSLKVGKYTLLEIVGGIDSKWMGRKVLIDNKPFDTVMVYDLPEHIAVIGHGDFTGKEVAFV